MSHNRIVVGIDIDRITHSNVSFVMPQNCADDLLSRAMFMNTESRRKHDSVCLVDWRTTQKFAVAVFCVCVCDDDLRINGWAHHIHAAAASETLCVCTARHVFCGCVCVFFDNVLCYFFLSEHTCRRVLLLLPPLLCPSVCMFLFFAFRDGKKNCEMCLCMDGLSLVSASRNPLSASALNHAPLPALVALAPVARIESQMWPPARVPSTPEYTNEHTRARREQPYQL